MSARQVLTAEQMRAAEQALFDAGTSVSELMEIAAGGAAEWIRRIGAGRSATVLCGPGNNGGDGYVIARKLRDRIIGWPARLASVVPADAMKIVTDECEALIREMQDDVATIAETTAQGQTTQ